jgi:hypothetical protein
MKAKPSRPGTIPRRLTSATRLLTRPGPALLASLLAASSLANAAVIEAVRTSSDAQRTRIVLDTDSAANYAVFTLSNPERVVIDIDNSNANTLAAQNFSGGHNGPLTALRHAKRGAGDLRVVFDLSRKVTAQSMQLGPDGGYGNRIVVDLVELGAGAGAESPDKAPVVASKPPARPAAIAAGDEMLTAPTPAPSTITPTPVPVQQAPAPAVARTTPSAALPQPAPSSAPASGGSGIRNMFSRFDRAMATFDPIGKHVRQPIERAVPRLQFRGFLRQWSDVLLERNGPIGTVNQDFRFLQLQNLFELETSYHVADGIDIKGIAHGLYDGTYDWQDSRGLYADSLDRTAEVYNTSERVLRELYVSYRKPGFDLKVGKQQVAWGKMDGQFIDIVNGMDRRESVQLESEDYEFRRLPTWMANSTFYFGDTTVQTLYVFDFEHDRNPLPGSPWASPLAPTSTTNIVLPTDRPEAGNFSDHEYGIRVDRAAGALTYGFIYMYAWDKNPVERVLGTSVQNGNTVLQVRAEHKRLHHAGATMDYGMTFQNVPVVGSLPTVFRVEALYTNGVRFADFEKRAEALAGSSTDGMSTHDTVRAAIAIEFGLPHRTTLIFQPSWYQTLNHKEGLGAGFGGGFGDEWSFIPVVFFSRPFAFTRDRLNMDLTLFPLIGGSDSGWGGLKTKLRMTYKFSQFVKGHLIYTGYDTGSSTDLYGQYNQWDNVGWELSYEF